MAQTPRKGVPALDNGFAAQVESLWRDGNYEKVKHLADNRLAADPEDLVGLILQLEYATHYLKLDDVSKTAGKIIAIGSRTKTPRFSRLYPQFANTLNAIQEAVRSYSPEALEKDRKKVVLNGESLGCASVLQALEDDASKQ
jgi:hypothetical protein